MDDWINSGNFSVRAYLLIIRKDSFTHIRGLVFYVKEGLSFARNLSLENSDAYSCFRLALLHSVSYFLFFYSSSSLSLSTVFGAVSSNIGGEILLMNPSANVFVFGEFNIHHKSWPTYSGETDRLVNYAIVVLYQMTLHRWLTFLLASLIVSLIVLLL